MIHLLTTRLKSHSKGDDNRPDDFIKELTESDLLNKLQKSNNELGEYYEKRLDFSNVKLKNLYNSSQPLSNPKRPTEYQTRDPSIIPGHLQ